MRRAIVLLAAMVVVGSSARADAPRTALKEHRLTVEESGKGGLPPDEGLDPTPEWTFPAEHLAQGARFTDPFVGPELFPEVSAGMSVGAAQLKGTRQFAHETSVDLSLYVLDVRIPVATSLDGTRAGRSIDASLKLPFAWPGTSAHRFALVYGALIPESGPAFSNSSRGELMYGLGLQRFSLQLRAGFGYEQLFADQELRQGLLYGATIGVPLGTFEPVVQVDGIRTVVTQSDRIALMPGLRIHPGGLNTLQLGASALIVLTAGDDAPPRRAGALLDISYNFL